MVILPLQFYYFLFEFPPLIQHNLDVLARSDQHLQLAYMQDPGKD